MKRTLPKLFLSLSGLVLLGSMVQAEPVQAETRYVTDVVYVPMRSGPGNQYRILHRGLKTGLKMTVLEADAGEGFSKVRMADGSEGYIPRQYLVAEQPARERLPKVLANVSRLSKENTALKSELSATENELNNVKGSLQETTGLLDDKTSQFIALREATADPQALDRRNKQLMEENLQLKNRIEVVEAENNQLIRSSSMRWYLYGGGTIIIGVLLGLFLPMIRFRKKPASDWV
ncbi:TIGR04211 family SH3 domain-containing protein [Endozoicomonas sp. 8E]|uniref:TIGR04211 family SH3 domain-containing protein n=1 Tax=Endozoicomonas sp. 8E TaxID=3035692 RepID=UPI0029390989|nr:TIGR04211 family SH3 domain-containing protein [Endozoicomonas sp. 8E]WOG25968.1 TIGR04211 family SH3 domain-containing protein [Endozoicomonas sp. 8E]